MNRLTQPGREDNSPGTRLTAENQGALLRELAASFPNRELFVIVADRTELLTIYNASPATRKEKVGSIEFHLPVGAGRTVAVSLHDVSQDLADGEISRSGRFKLGTAAISRADSLNKTHAIVKAACDAANSFEDFPGKLLPQVGPPQMNGQWMLFAPENLDKPVARAFQSVLDAATSLASFSGNNVSYKYGNPDRSSFEVRFSFSQIVASGIPLFGRLMDKTIPYEMRISLACPDLDDPRVVVQADRISLKNESEVKNVFRRALDPETGGHTFVGLALGVAQALKVRSDL